MSARLTAYPPLGGRYRLTSPLATGGMATVYRAVDERLGRTVAVKLLNPQYADNQAFAARFRQEAQLAAALVHPNIVTVFDWGVEQGRGYLVMELVEGESLRQRLRYEGSLAERRALAIARDVAAGLAEAHRHGIVHCDVKPGNILLDGQSSAAKLADFGIATNRGGLTEMDALEVFGSPAYASPEQASGGAVTAATDVYSLGVVLYEMLAGEPPFDGDSVSAITDAIRRQPPPALRAVRRDVSPETAALVARALEKDPARRFVSGDELRKAIDSVLATTRRRSVVQIAPMERETPTVSVSRYTTSTAAAREPAGASGARRRVPFPALAVGALLIGTLLAALLVHARGLPSATRPAEAATAQQVTVPKVAGLSLADAQAAASAVGLTVSVKDQEVTLDTPAGEVVTQDPHEDRNATRGSAIQVVMSNGVQVPNLVGSQCTAARQAATSNGWSVQAVRWLVANVPDFGKVVSQDPGGGSVVARKGEIQVQVAGPVGRC